MDSKNPTAGASTDNIIAHQARRWIKALERQFVITDDPQMPDEVREMAWNTACRCVVYLTRSMPEQPMRDAEAEMKLR